MVRMLDKAMRTYDFDTSRVSQTTLENYTNPQATATAVSYTHLHHKTRSSGLTPATYPFDSVFS